MAKAGASAMKVCDITECSICLETFKVPKALPCIHTFCLQCLDKHCESKTQDNVECPLCRKAFTVPPGGNINLPNNFFILQLLQVKQSTSVQENEAMKKSILCELCSDSEAEVSSTFYCIECDQHICDRCAAGHKKFKLFKSHQVIRDDDVPSMEDKLRYSISYCEQHPAEQNRMFCNDCEIVTCHVCFVDKHQKHDWMDVNKSAEKFREQIKNDVDNVSACASAKQERIKQIEIDKHLFIKRIATTEFEISEKCDQLITLIQSHKYQLMEELNTFQDKILKEVETEKDEIERQFVIAESFKRYCQEVINKGTAFDISRAAHDLHARAEELVKAQEECDDHKLSRVEITFNSSLSTTDNVKSLLGKLDLQGDTCSKKDFQQLNFTKFFGSLPVFNIMPSIAHDIIPCVVQPITGITVLGSELFVVRSTSQVNIYSADNFTLIRSLENSQCNDLYRLVSCAHYNCLYAVGPKRNVVYRYNLVNNVTTSWSVGGECYHLSVTKCYNVLATLYDTNRIQEYTTDGIKIREIHLNSSVDKPRHSVQLSTGNYAVCHWGAKQHRLCIVDQNGQVIQSYGGRPGTGIGKFYNPHHLAVDIHDNVMIADYGNYRVLLFSPTLTYLGDIVVPGFVFCLPSSLCFDKRSNRLYVGEWDGGRIFALGPNENE